jgi:hypothetical protein
MQYRCNKDIFLYCYSKDHIKVCDDYMTAHPKEEVPPSMVTCSLSPNDCTFSKKFTEIEHEHLGLGNSFRESLFPNTNIQDKKEKPKKKVKEEVKQRNMFG